MHSVSLYALPLEKSNHSIFPLDARHIVIKTREELEVDPTGAQSSWLGSQSSGLSDYDYVESSNTALQ
jgi:hypothetical protein